MTCRRTYIRPKPTRDRSAMSRPDPKKPRVMQEAILLPGGAGYIGSHVVVELLERTDYAVLVIDNLSNATANAEDPTKLPPSLERVLKIVNRGDQNNNPTVEERLIFHHSDYDNVELLKELNSSYKILATIIVAGFKAVGESRAFPLRYYRNNVCKTVTMLETLNELGRKNVIFSSSATVYNMQKDEDIHALVETDKTGECSCAYAKTKAMIEEILKDLCEADAKWKAVSLRYFNPVGAHPSGMIGEDPNGIPNNLMPFIAQVAIGRRALLSVFGNDYNTEDGTGVRDYLHVVDLAKAHVDAVMYLQKTKPASKGDASKDGFTAINLGSGKGSSVLQVLASFQKAAGEDVKIPWKYAARRPGDVTALYCDPSLALKLLNWKTTKTLDQMCEDMWKFQQNNPYGYANQESS